MDPYSLPVYQQRDKILSALQDHQVIVVESPTGSGKTTQIPLILHEARYTRRGIVGVTQPRQDRGGIGVRVHRAPDRKDDSRHHRLHDALRGQDRRCHGHQDHDRRDPAAGAEGRPLPVPLQRAHGRRGARAQPQHRFHPGHAEEHPRRASRVPRHRLLRHDQRGGVLRVFRRLPDREHRRAHVPRRAESTPLPRSRGTTRACRCASATSLPASCRRRSRGTS